MHRHARVFLALLSTTLCGCAAPAARDTFAPSASKAGSHARVGLVGRDHPTGRQQRSQSFRGLPARVVGADEADKEREKVLTTLRPYSAAWWTVHDEMEAATDSQLNRKLVICRGCFAPTATEDQTGSLSGK